MATSDAISGTGSTSAWDQTSTTPAKANNELADKETFLKLLVAQIKNQDPMNPSDGVQFLSQLAQFSSLEQTIRMGADLGAIRSTLETLYSAEAQN
jgi:flagellar basal-body rod modification protein FlgD